MEKKKTLIWWSMWRQRADIMVSQVGRTSSMKIYREQGKEKRKKSYSGGPFGGKRRRHGLATQVTAVQNKFYKTLSVSLCLDCQWEFSCFGTHGTWK